LRSLLIYLYNLKGGLFKRIIPSILRKSFLKKIQTVDLGFCKIILNLSNSIDREIYLKGFYEKEQIEYLDKISKDENIDCFLDIGSYIGYYSLYFRNIKNIYAFEPNKENFKHLQKNAEINDTSITIYNVACSDSQDNRLIWYTDKNKMGGSAIYDKNDPELSKYKQSDITFETIKTKRLDEILDIRGKSLLIKIDVERHEMGVLKGSYQNILNKNKIIMQIEIQKDLKNNIFNFLEKNNFKFLNSIGHDYYFKNY